MRQIDETASLLAVSGRRSRPFSAYPVTSDHLSAPKKSLQTKFDPCGSNATNRSSLAALEPELEPFEVGGFGQKR